MLKGSHQNAQQMSPNQNQHQICRCAVDPLDPTIAPQCCRGHQDTTSGRCNKRKQHQTNHGRTSRVMTNMMNWIAFEDREDVVQRPFGSMNKGFKARRAWPDESPNGPENDEADDNFSGCFMNDGFAAFPPCGSKGCNQRPMKQAYERVPDPLVLHLLVETDTINLPS